MPDTSPGAQPAKAKAKRIVRAALPEAFIDRAFDRLQQELHASGLAQIFSVAEIILEEFFKYSMEYATSVVPVWRCRDRSDPPQCQLRPAFSNPVVMPVGPGICGLTARPVGGPASRSARSYSRIAAPIRTSTGQTVGCC